VKTKAISAVLLLAVCGAIALSAPFTHAASSCDRQPVMQIDSGHVSVEPDGISISAFGTSESAGWSGATLLVAAREGSTATVDFVACRPEMAAQVLTPIKTQATLDLPPDTSRIIIRARTNSMTVDINPK
jgi:hypothetical protein